MITKNRLAVTEVYSNGALNVKFSNDDGFFCFNIWPDIDSLMSHCKDHDVELRIPDNLIEEYPHHLEGWVSGTNDGQS